MHAHWHLVEGNSESFIKRCSKVIVMSQVELFSELLIQFKSTWVKRKKKKERKKRK